jgi:hypothetical protein
MDLLEVFSESVQARDVRCPPRGVGLLIIEVGFWVLYQVGG